MADPTKPAAFYADFSGLAALKKSAAQNDPKAVREAARQFESLFTRMMLKSMRSASIGDSMFDSKETEFYRDMYDDQLANDLSKGKGIGLADMLVQQLTRSGLTKGNSAAAALSGAQNSSSVATSVAQATTTTASAAASKSQCLANSPQDFVNKMWPYAQQAGQQLGVDPRTLIAHAALETGWGQKVPVGADGASSNNLFGIKANHQWTGATAGSRTVEYEDGVAVSKVQRFRSYASPAHSFADYAALLANSSRYAGVRGSGADSASFAAALQQGGYATDPAYANKLKAVAAQVNDLAGVKAGSDANTDIDPLKLVSNEPLRTSEGGSSPQLPAVPTIGWQRV